eukprot:2276720-Amphidinium_carterae.1
MATCDMSYLYYLRFEWCRSTGVPSLNQDQDVKTQSKFSFVQADHTSIDCKHVGMYRPRLSTYFEHQSTPNDSCPSCLAAIRRAIENNHHKHIRC